MSIKVVRANSLEWVPANIPKGSVALISTDPPFGRIVKQGWDTQWSLEDQWRMTEVIEEALMPGGTAYVYGGVGKPKDRLFFKWLSEVEDRSGLTLYDVITWRKKRAIGSKYRYLFTREECAMLVKGDRPKTFNVPLLDEKRGYAGFSKKYAAKSEYLRRTNVWTDITELFRGKIHECEKPPRLAEVMIETSSNPGDLVIDMFAGSGSTGVGAENVGGRDCILIEMSDCQMHFDAQGQRIEVMKINTKDEAADAKYERAFQREARALSYDWEDD